MNLGTLTTTAAQFAGDPQQSRYANLYTDALNKAQQQFALDSHALWKDNSIAVVGGTATYSLPADFMWEKMVTYSKTNGNTLITLKPVSRAELMRGRGDDWTQVTGDPIYYIIDPEEARKQLRLFPYPPSGDAGGTAVLTYYPLPVDLANPADVPLNSYALLAQFHVGISAWAAWYLLQGETQVTDALERKKKDLLQIYNDHVSLASSLFKNTTSELMRMRGGRTYR